MKNLITTIFVLLTTGTLFSQFSNNLILHYSFDAADATDQVGNNHGTLNGVTPCPDRFGNPNMAFNFNSSSIDLPTCSLGQLSEATVSVWLEPDAVVYSAPPKFTPLSMGQWVIYINKFSTGGNLLGAFDGSSDNNSSSDPTDPITSGWRHFVMTNDGTTTKLYIDGNLESSYAENFMWNDATTGLYLGVRTYGGGAPADYYIGKMDEFKIFNKALNIEEIDSLFNIRNPLASIDEDLNQEEIVIYPNPTSGRVNLEMPFNESKTSEIKIYDTKGSVVHNESLIGSKTIEIDLSKLKKGIYFYRIQQDVDFYQGKIIKQ